MSIRVAVADDHPIFVAGLEQLLQKEPDFELVAKCTDSEQVLPAVLEHSPDVLVLDLQMPKKNGLALMRDLSKAGVNVRVVLLTGSITDEEVVEALRLGVRGVLLKEMAPRLLLECIRKVHAGGQWIERGSIGRAIEKMLRREEAMKEIAGVLTKREIDLVRLVARGLRNKEIAEQLKIKEGTVKMHLYSIFQKLKLSNRVELTLYAREKGFA
jgi:DNA-binding NarL/FixJ family response regulator